MWGLEGAGAPAPRPLLAGTPIALLAALAAATLLGVSLVVLGLLPPAALRVLGVAGGHGALLATALGWAETTGAGPRPVTVRAGVAMTLLLAGAAGATAVHPMGMLAYVGPPLWLGWLAHQGRLHALGLGPGGAGRGALAGACLGLGLGAHLLVAASRTFGYRPHLELDVLLPAVAYDLGANVLSGECFFRGALFNRAQRRWSFAPAALLATGAAVVRYLVDPLLPRTVEIAVGAVFYVTLLGVGNCWLLWRYGSLVPGLLSGLVFFAAYRAIAPLTR